MWLAGFRMRLAGFRMRLAGFRMRLAGFRMWLAGFRMWLAGFRMWLAGFRMWLAGLRMRLAGLRMRLWRVATHVCWLRRSRRFGNARWCGRRLRGGRRRRRSSRTSGHALCRIVALGRYPDLSIFAGGCCSLGIRLLAACRSENALVFLLQRFAVGCRCGGLTRRRCGGDGGCGCCGRRRGRVATKPPPQSDAKRQHDHEHRPQRAASAPHWRERRAEVRRLPQATVGLGFLQSFENQRHGQNQIWKGAMGNMSQNRRERRQVTCGRSAGTGVYRW